VNSELQPVIGGSEDQVRQVAQTLRSGRSPSPKVFTGAWVPSQREKRKYACLFKRLDWDADGYILGEEARELLERSGLDAGSLAAAWEHADQDRDGKLDFREFVTLVHMVTCTLRGARLPPPQQGPPPDLIQALSTLEPMHHLVAEREASRSRSASPAPSGFVTPSGTGAVTPRGRSGWEQAHPQADPTGSGTWGAGAESTGQDAWGGGGGSPLDQAGGPGGGGWGSSDPGGASAAASAPGFGNDGRGGWGSNEDSPSGFGGSGSAPGPSGSFGEPDASPFDTGPLSAKKEKKSKRGKADGFGGDFGFPPSETQPVASSGGGWGEPTSPEGEEAFDARQSEHERRQREAEHRQQVQQQLQALAAQFDSIMAADREVSRQLRREVDELGEELAHLSHARDDLRREHDQEKAEEQQGTQTQARLRSQLDAAQRRLAEVRELRRSVDVDSLSLRRDREHCREELDFMQGVSDDETQVLSKGLWANDQLKQSYLDLEEHTDVLERQRRGLTTQVQQEAELVRQEERRNAELRNRLEQARRQHLHSLNKRREEQMRFLQHRTMQEASHGGGGGGPRGGLHPAAFAGGAAGPHTTGHLWAHTMNTGTGTKVANTSAPNELQRRLGPPSLFAAT